MAVESRLPADLLHLLSEQLSATYDFPTLYNCVVSSKHLAKCGAVSAMYRVSHESPLKGGGNEALPLAEQELNVQKWSILWRTIILSTLGKTVHPYSRYLRMLDLRDLQNLLEDDKFRGKIAKQFFSGALSHLHFTVAVSGRAPRLDNKKIIIAIGDLITEHSPLLEQLSEPPMSNLLSTSLSTWAPRLTHLRSLEFGDGKALADESLRNLLHVHCPKIEILRIYISSGDDSDHNLAAFIGGMQENTLTYFENISTCGIGAETCLALNTHGKSLTQIKLALGEDGILALGLLQNCTAVEKLSMSALRSSVDLKATQNDVYLQIIEWLKNSASLKELSFHNMLSAPDLALPVLLNKAANLEELDINAPNEEAMYVVKDHRDFHEALKEQPNLRRLQLRADPDPMVRDDLEALMNAFCSLTNLRDLKLTRISDYLSDEHIILLARHLVNLEDLYVGGYGISNAIFEAVGGLKSLKSATFSGITTFTSEGIADFIDRLGAGNAGFVLSVDSADPDSIIPPEEQDLLRDLIQVKVDGRFEYQLLRDPNAPDFDSDDSD